LNEWGKEDEDSMLAAHEGVGYSRKEVHVYMELTAHVGEVVQLQPVGHVAPGIVLLHHLV
jgi:hypothetical protein